MSIEVIKPGMNTTIQDLGRNGFQKYGIIVGGAMDTLALRLANYLVGNDEGAAGMEITLKGPRLLFHEEMLIAICGGDLSPEINGEPVALNRPVWVRKGSMLQFGYARKGCRAYLAVEGGFDVPIVLGSRDTNLRAGIGGYHGRALAEGDIIQRQQRKQQGNYAASRQLAEKMDYASFAAADWHISQSLFPSYTQSCIRVIPAEHFACFTAESRSAFFASEYQITPHSDRMGYRLSGAKLELTMPLELTSEAVTVGTIQVPPEGNPIVLMADRQTTGGYPKIGHVATVDLPLLAQFKPGEMVRFQEITLREAQSALLRREATMKRIKLGLQLFSGRGERG
ncbi:biotin-dependent carboxyltransferase family protein [Brevibacillus fulvus]|uniref:Antagonist of KipI n=1 Tax=Brevibacillus fulvus TaxID=1125967 RepID=A0A938XVT1_9BACL|nr:biotin-dependent carboxyltransferase family protein [Brevibacillus fulvus]MBM7588866.1 antagonist of KipI [Brevibacillus fulvus]